MLYYSAQVKNSLHICEIGAIIPASQGAEGSSQSTPRAVLGFVECQVNAGSTLADIS